MASTYPGAIDSTADSGSLDLPDDDSLVEDLPSIMETGAHAAIIAVESTLGVNPQDDAATVSARIAALASRTGVVQSVKPGTNITVDDSDAANPTINGVSASLWDDATDGISYGGGTTRLYDAGDVGAVPLNIGGNLRIIRDEASYAGAPHDQADGVSRNTGSYVLQAWGNTAWVDVVKFSYGGLGMFGTVRTPEILNDGAIMFSNSGSGGARYEFRLVSTDRVFRIQRTHSNSGPNWVDVVTIDNVTGDVTFAGNITAPNLTPPYYRDGADYLLLGTNATSQSNSGQLVSYVADYAYFWLIKTVEDIGVIGIKPGYIQTPQPDAKFRIWLYEADTSIPTGAPLLDSGDMDGSARAYESATFAQVNLKADRYYMAAIVTNDSDLAFRGASDGWSSGQGGPWLTLGAHSAPGVQAATLRASAAYGAPPASAPGVATITNPPPLVYWTVKR